MPDSDSDSDYIVEEYVRPDKIGAPPINDESADILGNFDDQKRKNIANNIDDEAAEKLDEDNSDSDSDTDESDEEPEDEDPDDSVVDDNSGNALKRKQISDKIDGSGETRRAKIKRLMAAEEERDGRIGEEQITSLLQGVSKANRFVLYVTNLNFATSKERLAEYFSSAGIVKSVRIPKKRKGGFAFVEMADVNSFQVWQT